MEPVCGTTWLESTYADQYAAAQRRTVAAAPFGLVREAAALARQIRLNPQRLAAHRYPIGMELATTCCCHVVVDDPNYGDDSVAGCIVRAAREEHPDCLRLALLLARASLTQRRKINRVAWFGPLESQIETRVQAQRIQDHHEQQEDDEDEDHGAERVADAEGFEELVRGPDDDPDEDDEDE